MVGRQRLAFGKPGIEPRWTRSAKDAVGTAYSSSSSVWFTVSAGILNEVYYPTIDRPQIRDLQYLVTDGKSFFHDERRHLATTIEYLDRHSLGVRITNSDPEGRYRILKEVISDPHRASVLVHTVLQGDERILRGLRLFALLAPHLGGGGWGGSGEAFETAGGEILTAHTSRDRTWLALGATLPFARRSCGYVGASDGWTDLALDFEMDWEFDGAEDGNIALTAEIDLSLEREFTLGLSFGESRHHAVTSLFQSLGFPFSQLRSRFSEQWTRACDGITPLAAVTGDGGALYHVSHSLLLAHEDKTYPGAMIASLSIPWGEARGDDDLGGYHLVWTRDLVNGAAALLASGNTETPLRALIYMAASQREDGGFYQNFWIDGQPYGQGVQLDEVALPILLAWRLREETALRDFDPYPMVRRAAAYLIREGPATPQDRWEENGGYSPSTLATNIAALICASGFARDRHEPQLARYLEEYADFLAAHVEDWTVTTRGGLVPGIPRHYIRINPVPLDDSGADEDPDRRTLTLRNHPPGEPSGFEARSIVDAGFLELVRYGIRKPGDTLVEDSLAVVDAVLKVETPVGPCWHRYNHDGYGQREDGGAFEGWGRGRAWPLLTGERGHYELAAGRDAGPYVRAMEGFASACGLLPEQIWDEPDRPDVGMYFGRPTGAAMPLMWAHAEYVKLLRSAIDGVAFDRVSEVAARYLSGRQRASIEVWKFNRQPRSVRAGRTLRIQTLRPFSLRWTRDEWIHAQEGSSIRLSIGLDYLDIAIEPGQRGPIRFTFFWLSESRWEGRDFAVAVEPGVEAPI